MYARVSLFQKFGNQRNRGLHTYCLQCAQAVSPLHPSPKLMGREGGVEMLFLFLSGFHRVCPPGQVNCILATGTVVTFVLSQTSPFEKNYRGDLQAYCYLTIFWQRISFENRIKERKIRVMDGFIIRKSHSFQASVMSLTQDSFRGMIVLSPLRRFLVSL